jgi:hypothetical protein
VAKKPDVRVLIDTFLRADKILAVTGDWKSHQDGDDVRWIAPVEMNGEQPGINLIVKFYPNEAKLQFTILLAAAQCIWRLDFTDTPHVNPLNAPSLPGFILKEPHYHSWADNRLLCKANSLPKRLPNARLLPLSITTFAPAFRWFADETKIYVESGDIPELPKKESLL